MINILLFPYILPLGKSFTEELHLHEARDHIILDFLVRNCCIGGNEKKNIEKVENAVENELRFCVASVQEQSKLKKKTKNCICIYCAYIHLISTYSMYNYDLSVIFHSHRISEPLNDQHRISYDRITFSFYHHLILLQK